MRNRVRTLTPAIRALIADQAATAPHTLGLVKPRRVRRAVELVPDVIHVTAEPARVEVTAGVRLASRANVDSHGHWTVRHRGNKALAASLGVLLSTVPADVRERLAAGCVCRLSRIAPNRLDDWENLRASLKGVKDIIARWLLDGRMGQHDEDGRIDWREPGQEAAGKAYGVRVVLWEAEH